jgi:hypothetical protein
MRLLRALALPLLVVLLAPVIGAGAASAEGDAATKVTIAGKPRVGVFRDDLGPKSTPDVVRHRGRLTTADGAPVAGATVQLQRQLTGGDLATSDGTTDSDGTYEFFTPIAGNATYRVVYAGDVGYESAESGVVDLKAMRDFNARLVEKARVAIFKGDINPEWNDKVVTWQRKTCKTCAWKTIASEKSGDTGTWRFRGAYPPVNKKWFYRAALAGTELFVKSYSATLITTTTPARQPTARTAVR